MDVHVEEKSADLPRDHTPCPAHVQDGGVLLLTLSQHHLVVILTIFSSVACFWYLVLLTKRRKSRAQEQEVEEGCTQDAVRRQSEELARCQDCVGYIDLSFGLFQLTAFITLQYLPQLIQQERIELQYVWMYLGRWHIAAFLKTTWFVVTIVTQKSSLYRICQTLSVRFFKTTERPFNTIAFYMLMTSYIMLPVVIDILSLYTFAERYRYGVCVQILKMSPLCLVVIIFYASMIVISINMLCVHWFKGNGNAFMVAIATRRGYEPALLSDNDDDLINDASDVHPTENNSNSDGHGNYIRNITENQDFRLNGQIKTIDEVVGYEKNEKSTDDEVKLIEKRNKRHKLKIVAMAVLEPLLLWLWVVVVLHGNAGLSLSTNVDYGNMMLLWTVIAAFCTLVSACCNGSK